MKKKPHILAARRRLLKQIMASGAVAGGGLQLKSWTSPVVQSIVLPTHATLSSQNRVSVSDPCFLTVTCVNEGNQVEVQAAGQVVGPPGTVGGLDISLTLRLMNGGTLVDTAGPFNTTTLGNGSWGPIPIPAHVFNAAGANAVEGVVSSPGAIFTPDRCRQPFDCDGPPGGEEPPTECTSEWDKSSLVFDEGSMNVCNKGDGTSLCLTSYEIWRSTSGNPKNGSIAAVGTVGPLGDGCHDFLAQVQALCISEGGGRFKVKVYQHEGHPGTGELWSATYVCDSGFESED